MPKIPFLSLLLVLSTADAGQVTVAVAANFTAPMKALAPLFERATGHTARISYGSTGKLYAQIINGAPYEVFLSADSRRPRMLQQAGIGEIPFTYAVGRLALWSPDPTLVDERGDVLKRGRFQRLAIANPKTAPYGAGAIQVLSTLGVDEPLDRKLIRGDNIAQTFQFVVSGNVPLGFVAISQVKDSRDGSMWVPPQSMYTPIRQDAILLKSAAKSPAARAFVRFLQTDAAHTTIASYGYSAH